MDPTVDGSKIPNNHLGCICIYIYIYWTLPPPCNSDHQLDHQKCHDRNGAKSGNPKSRIPKYGKNMIWSVHLWKVCVGLWLDPVFVQAFVRAFFDPQWVSVFFQAFVRAFFFPSVFVQALIKRDSGKSHCLARLGSVPQYNHKKYAIFLLDRMGVMVWIAWKALVKLTPTFQISKLIQAEKTRATESRMLKGIVLPSILSPCQKVAWQLATEFPQFSSHN